MTYKLGKLPARPDAVKLKLRKYIDETALPTPPLRFGHYWRVDPPWGVLGNHDYGDCVWAGAAHEEMVWHATGAKPLAAFNDKNVLSDYSAVTGFDPKHAEETDNGTDMQQAASYRRRTGIVDSRGRRHKIDSYVALKAGDVDELMLATYLFGAVGFGFSFPESAFKQFDRQVPWDVVPSRVSGGHYVSVVGRNSKGNILLVTWGRLHAMSPDFVRKYNDESICYLSLDSLNSALVSREGFDVETLRSDLGAL